MMYVMNKTLVPLTPLNTILVVVAVQTLNDFAGEMLTEGFLKVCIREMMCVQPKRSLFSASPTERKGCLLLAVGSNKKGDIKNGGKKDKWPRNLATFACFNRAAALC